MQTIAQAIEAQAVSLASQQSHRAQRTLGVLKFMAFLLTPAHKVSEC